MRILQINKFFYRRGGAEVVFLDTINGLRSRGFEVAEFSTRDSRNLPSDYAEFFTESPGELSGKFSFWQGAKIFKKFLRSQEVEKNLRTLILAVEPDVAHLHNIYRHLSASTFVTLKKMGVPIVMTVHDVFPLVPNHTMICQGHLCEKSFRHKYYRCVWHRSINNQFLPSLAGALEAYYYWLRGIWKMVDIFVCPSQFMADKMAAWGFPRERLRVVRNAYVVPPNVGPLGRKILYLGRLQLEKGIKVFMQALPMLRQYEVVIAGMGPEEKWVDNFISQYSLTNVRRVGQIVGDDWKKIMAEAKVVVMPSVVNENCSMTILESLSFGRLVVASDRGGNPELIKEGRTGFLFKPESHEDLVRAVKKAMATSDDLARPIIQAGRELVAANHDESRYFSELAKIYQELKK